MTRYDADFFEKLCLDTLDAINTEITGYDCCVLACRMMQVYLNSIDVYARCCPAVVVAETDDAAFVLGCEDVVDDRLQFEDPGHCVLITPNFLIDPTIGQLTHRISRIFRDPLVVPWRNKCVDLAPKEMNIVAGKGVLSDGSACELTTYVLSPRHRGRWWLRAQCDYDWTFLANDGGRPKYRRLLERRREACSA